MTLESFRKLEKINIEGMLLMLAESARMFKLQGTGGDIVLVSTKNVFAPGARFGAYSATKAAGHQLARIASQEFAEYGCPGQHGRPRMLSFPTAHANPVSGQKSAPKEWRPAG